MKTPLKARVQVMFENSNTNWFCNIESRSQF